MPTSQRNALDRSVRGRAPSAERESCRAPASGSIYHHTIWCDGGPGDGQGGGAQVGGRRPRGSLKALLSIRHHGRAGTGAGCCAAIPAVWICRPSHEHAVPPQCTSSVGPGDGIHCRGRCTRVRTLLRPQQSLCSGKLASTNDICWPAHVFAVKLVYGLDGSVQHLPASLQSVGGWLAWSAKAMEGHDQVMAQYPISVLQVGRGCGSTPA